MINGKICRTVFNRISNFDLEYKRDPHLTIFGPEKEGGLYRVQARENYRQRGYGKVSDTFSNNYGKREFN